MTIFQRMECWTTKMNRTFSMGNGTMMGLKETFGKTFSRKIKTLKMLWKNFTESLQSRNFFKFL